MIPRDLFFSYPYGIYGLFLVLLFVFLFFSLSLYRQKISAELGMPQLKRNPFTYWMKAALWMAAWFFGVLAWMGPQGNVHYLNPMQVQTFKQPPQDLIILIDTSASMSVKDTRSGVSRLDFAKEILDQFISKLSGPDVTLYSYTANLNQLAPLTIDYPFVRLILKDLQVNDSGAPGSNLIGSIADIHKAYFENADGTMKSLFIFSDGGDELLDQKSSGERKEGITTIAKLIPEDVTTYTIGLGNTQASIIEGQNYEGKPVQSALQEEILKGLGTYFQANQYSSVELGNELAKQVEKNRAEATQSKEKEAMHRPTVTSQYFQWPLALAILALIGALILPNIFFQEKVQ